MRREEREQRGGGRRKLSFFREATETALLITMIKRETHVAIMPTPKPLLTLFGSSTVLMVLLRSRERVFWESWESWGGRE